VGKRLFITSERIGNESIELGSILMKNFLYSVARAEHLPVAVTLMNGGVRLACAGSASLDDLRMLEEKGVDIKSCGTCLDYLHLSDKLEVGEVGTMQTSADALLGGDDIVTIG